jgi:hypothetical protein
VKCIEEGKSDPGTGEFKVWLGRSHAPGSLSHVLRSGSPSHCIAFPRKSHQLLLRNTFFSTPCHVLLLIFIIPALLIG